ncbi:polysaccharide biosynthesis/export family protein [Nafulsella turpanensis]|uniref:polysaccharide biosynthesis/export family protein n=1 Tax=Nafulsella turpanensis TaxID=1265690 RepID=UPI00126945BD|nr:polysaccharide biosynthesis/export family protein [Nafulsella turpanensis]
MYRLLVGLLLLTLFSQCVPVRKQTYLQERPGELNNYPKDTVVKTLYAGDYAYSLQPGDILSIKIASLTPEEYDFFSQAGSTGAEGEDPLLSGYLIDPDGNIELPVVGEIELQGLSLPEARQKIFQAVDGYLKSPTVRVKLLNFNYTVLGEVAQQGTFTTFDPKYSIMEAVGNAGGLSEYADRANVKIVRRMGEQVDIAFVNLLDDELIESPYFYLKPNDLIIVRPLKAKTFNTFTARNIALGISLLTSLTLIFLRFGPGGN